MVCITKSAIGGGDAGTQGLKHDRRPPENLAYASLSATWRGCEAFLPGPEGRSGGAGDSFPADQQLNFLSYFSDAKQFNVYDRGGNLTASFNHDEFSDNVAEMRAEWSFAKFPYLERFGFPQGILLVGPLARLYQENGPLNDLELQEFPLARWLGD